MAVFSDIAGIFAVARETVLGDATPAVVLASVGPLAGIDQFAIVERHGADHVTTPHHQSRFDFDSGNYHFSHASDQSCK